MNILAETDIVNSATPLETRYVDIHPRLFADAAEIAALRDKVQREPWAGFLRRVRAQADAGVRQGQPAAFGDIRGVGDALVHLAVAYRLTDERAYFDTAVVYLTAMAAREDWSTCLQYGHWALGAAVAYDWLYRELDPELREAIRRRMAAATERVYAMLTSYASAASTGYAWNHMMVLHGGLIAAGCALWGEVDGAGRWLRLGMEKLRLMVDALGPDGASAEGLPYGQYYLDYLTKSMYLGERLLGVNYLDDCAFLRHYPRFMLYSMLPRAVWSPSSTFVCLGDNDGAHWNGPDQYLRLAAARFRDPYAQWLAGATAAAGINADSPCFLNLFWQDDTVTPASPDVLPRLHHCDDKDIVFLRSD
ncbi:MAG TPA: DUF4962 domain-containing protein [Armatimonadota bacterium]|nr:DUF4962 domain-containing protein [Armatimonadota bacterium]